MRVSKSYPTRYIVVEHESSNRHHIKEKEPQKDRQKLHTRIEVHISAEWARLRMFQPMVPESV